MKVKLCWKTYSQLGEPLEKSYTPIKDDLEISLNDVITASIKRQEDMDKWAESCRQYREQNPELYERAMQHLTTSSTLKCSSHHKKLTPKEKVMELKRLIKLGKS